MWVDDFSECFKVLKWKQRWNSSDLEVWTVGMEKHPIGYGYQNLRVSQRRWTVGEFLPSVVNFIGRVLTTSYVLWIKSFNLVIELTQESARVYLLLWPNFPENRVKEKGFIWFTVWGASIHHGTRIWQNPAVCALLGQEAENRGTREQARTDYIGPMTCTQWCTAFC